MSRFPLASGARLSALVVLAVVLGAASSAAAPTKEVAKRCLRFSYVAYPFKGPGAAPLASADRQAYYKDCLAKNGNVPVPAPPPKQ
jgi:hypothetical protein